MVKEFWESVIYTILGFTALLIIGWFTYDKKSSVSVDSTFEREYSNENKIDELKNCLEKYKTKLKEDEQAISNAQKYLNGTYNTKSCDETVAAAYDQLGVFLMSPSCY